jgi:hypothetical protein
MNKIKSAFLWAGTKEVTGGRCKLNWEAVCRPKNIGGLGILYLEKLASALRLRWPWLERRHANKLWVGMGNPCAEIDMDCFYASTTITIRNGKIATFSMPTSPPPLVAPLGKVRGACLRQRIFLLLHWVAAAKTLVEASGGWRRPGPRSALLHLPASRRCEVVLQGFSHSMRFPGAATLGWMAEASLFFVRDGRPEDGRGESFALLLCPSGEVGRRGSR